jgi:hypothetical protein
VAPMDFRFLRVFLLVIFAGFAALAQDSGVTQSGNVTTYDSAFFAPFKPITAEDILNRIPGVQDLFQETTTNQKDDKRGFGATGDQILFNGRRLSSKSVSVASALQRIQAGQVVRVEVIRGDAAGMDVRSEGVLINLVLTESLATGSGTWEAAATHYAVAHHPGDFVKYGGKLTYAGDIGALGYVAGLEVKPKVDGRRRDGRLFTPTSPRVEQLPATPPIQRLLERHHVEQTEYDATGALTYTIGNHNVLNVNGRLYREKNTEDNALTSFDLLAGGGESFAGDPTNFRKEVEDGYELGADYEHTFAGGDTLKLVGIYNHASADDVRDFFLRTATRDFGKTRTHRIFPVADEKIARATWRTRLNERHAFEFGGEAALNGLTSRIERIDVVGNVTTNVPLFNPSGEVKETRFETFASWTWRPTGALTFDVAADTESSKLDQRGRDVSSDRSFFFVKPRLDVRFTPAPRNQLRLKAQRTVSQLDFADFLPGFNNEPLRVEVLRAGNPNLVPDKRWTYEAVYEYRLPDDQGVISLRGYYIDISDFIEQIPIDLTSVSATGNLGKASDAVAELKAGLRLGFIGLPNATVDLFLQKRRTRVTDPFDGRTRGFQRAQVGNWEVDFRHDTTWRNFAYGTTVSNRAHHTNAEPNFFGRFNSPLTVAAFAEVKVVGDVLLRFDGKRLFDKGAPSFRYIYGGRRGVAGIANVERSEVRFPRELRLSLRGTF